MSTLVIHHPVSRTSLTPPPSPNVDTKRPNSAPIPNKHLAYCPPGPAPGASQQTLTPPASPPSKHTGLQAFSRLYPPNTYTRLLDQPPVYSIDAFTLAAATNELAGQLFPEPHFAFPWLHGLHAENQSQLAFFIARRKALRNTPTCFRGITVVKVGGDLTRARLKGAISEDEVLEADRGQAASFLDVDPREGFSVRNFQIQTAKMAMVSDIVVYTDERARDGEARKLAERLAFSQRNLRVKNSNNGDYDAPVFSTFVLSNSFSDIEIQHPEIVAIDSQGHATGKMLDFSHCERQEMSKMSKASEIANNVWLGPTPDSLICPPSEDHPIFDIFVEASDLAQSPDAQTLKRIGERSVSAPQHIDFPSSGSIMPQTNIQSGIDSLEVMCEWIQSLANPRVTVESNSEDEEVDSDGDISMIHLNPRPRKFLIHCTDGYTESTLLALAYYMYAEQIPAHEAWLRLHCEKKRNFFAYPSDVALLASLQHRLVPTLSLISRVRSTEIEPVWISRIDGSLPSRILPYMYLGNLAHANNPDLLKAMGIKRLLSIGEPVNWTKAQVASWGAKYLLFVDRVQDNGVDPLMRDFERCLEFVGRGKADESATLVHCRVGVSRSATICIAEVMSSLGLSFPRAYCYVRARRLNVIIQPHLRFAYELLKWDEVCQQKRGEPVKRELEWATIAREIAAMNKPYASR